MIISPRIALALLYGGMPTPLLTKLGPSLIFPKKVQKLEQNAEENKHSKMESSQRLARANSSKENIGSLTVAGRADWEADELERIDLNVVNHLDKLAGKNRLDNHAGKSLEDGEDSGSRVVEHWFALLQWLHLDLDLKEARQGLIVCGLNLFDD